MTIDLDALEAALAAHEKRTPGAWSRLVDRFVKQLPELLAELRRLREAERAAEVRGATWALEDTTHKDRLGAGFRAAAIVAARRETK